MIVRFRTTSDFLQWFEEQQKTRAYNAYYTDKEVIVVPTVSTRPIVEAYIEADTKLVVAELEKTKGIKLWSVSSITFERKLE